MQWREGLKETEGKEKELKEEKEECKAQVLNGERERERERSHLCKSVRKIFSVLQDCCNCVAVRERQSFRLFNFFAVYK